MKPILEHVNVDKKQSVKIRTYTAADQCSPSGWHIHPEYEMVFIKNGNGVLNIGSQKIPYENGVLVFLAGNIPHTDFGNQDFPNNREVVIQFKKDFISNRLDAFPELGSIQDFLEEAKDVMVFEDQIKTELASKFLRFEHLDDVGKLINLLDILRKLSRTKSLENLMEGVTAPSQKHSDIKRLETVFEYVNTHYAQTITLSDMADKLGLTTNSFSRFFKQMTQRRFVDFLNDFRIQKAAELFKNSDDTVNQVMYQCGFTNPSYFTKQFRHYRKMTPTTYLKLLRNR
ncbi:MAG: AraC family transcriptional regulator [Bacteroidota bacterium]